MVTLISTRKLMTFAALVAVAAFALLVAPRVQAAVQAELDRNRVTVGETVTLTFRTDNPRQKLAPDLSVLDADFRVLDQRSETQLSIVNNRQTALVRLLVTLEPRREGELAIPSFAIDQDRTNPLTLSVEPAPELAPGQLPPVFLEVEVLPKDGPFYVHAQLGLLVRIFYLPETTDAAISPPEPDPAAVRLLQETPYQAERGGERYRVLERHYAVFPERSGELVIPAMQLSGRLVERNNSAVWQPRVRGRRINAQSDEIRLDIRPRPADFAGNDWLPARQLKLSQQVSAANSLKVGEPVTRTVIVEATGLEENMLVEPAWPEVQGVRIYPDQPQGITRDDGQWVLGHKEFRYAVVPEKEGELVLPELALHWWDTVNDQPQRAVLPERRITVEASALVPPPAGSEGVLRPLPRTAPVGTGPAEPGYWRWLALGFAVAWLVTLVFALRRRPLDGGKEKAASPRSPSNADTLLRDLKAACREGDAPLSRQLLSRWLNAVAPDFQASERSLLVFAGQCGDPELRDAIYALDAHGFRADGSAPWNGERLFDRLLRWQRHRKEGEAGQEAGLTDLYAPGRQRSG